MPSFRPALTQSRATGPRRTVSGLETQSQGRGVAAEPACELLMRRTVRRDGGGVPAGDGSPFFGGGDIVVKPPFTTFSLFITHLCFAAQRERGYVQRLHFASNVQMVSQPQSNQDQADSTELPRGILQLYTGSVTPAYLKI